MASNYSGEQSRKQRKGDELPHSRESEEAVCGSVLIDPFVYEDLSRLKPDDFYIHRLRFVWEAYTRLYARNVPIDSLTVTQELDDMGKLDEIGGPAYLTALLNQVPTTLNAGAYADIIEKMKYRRDGIESLNRQAQAFYDESLDLPEVMAVIEKERNVITGAAPSETAGSVSRDLSRVYDKIEARAKLPKFQPIGYSTGWGDLDLVIDGLQSDCYYIIAALRGVGKTAFMLNMALSAARTGVQVAFYSREMSRERLLIRLLALISGINSRLIRHGAFGSQDENDRYHDAYNELAQLPIRIFSPEECRTVEMIDSSARRLKAAGEIDLAMVDYAQILQTSQNKSGNREQEVAAISRTLNSIKGIDVGIVAAAQVGREVEKMMREPQLSDLRESGSLENDADTVMFLHANDTANPNARQVIVAKNRDGEAQQRVDMIFDAPKMRFLQVTKQNVQSSNFVP